VAFPRLTSRPLDRRMVLLPSRNSISSTCVLTCPFVGAQSRGSYDFPRVRGPIVPPGAPHTPSLDAAVPLPNCLLCKGHASPPGRMGWLSVGGDQQLFSICGTCAWNCDDPEHEAKIVAHVSDRGGVSGRGSNGPAPPPAPSAPRPIDDRRRAAEDARTMRAPAVACEPRAAATTASRGLRLGQQKRSKRVGRGQIGVVAGV
jgi:hypothetical protein